MIRPMTLDDLPRLIEMGREFYDESEEYKLYSFDEDKLVALGHLAMEGEYAICLVHERDGTVDGMLYGFAYEQFFSEDMSASEMFVFASKDARGAFIGKRLLMAFELWAESLGVKEMRVGVSAGITTERTIGLYKKLGYNYNSTMLKKAL